jgi:Domain of unknown function (DUF4190)
MSFNVPATEPGWTVPGPDGPAAHRRRSTNGLAITTLVLGVAGFLVITIPVNLVLGLVALVRTRRRGDKGTALAVIGMVLSILWAVGIAVGVAQLMKSPDPKRDANGRISAPQKAGPDKLRVGDCVARQTGDVTDVQAQPCTQPGGDKVFSIFQLPQQPWPGDAAVANAAEKGCTKRYQASHKASQRAELIYFTPTKTRWALDYRKVVCLVGAAS